MHPKFPNASKASLILETDKGSGPLDLHAPVAEYGPEDDAAIEKYTREFGQFKSIRLWLDGMVLIVFDVSSVDCLAFGTSLWILCCVRRN